MRSTYHHSPNVWIRALAVLPLFALAVGCELRQAMYDQPKYRPLQESSFFENGMASRPLIEGTVARGLLEDDPHLFEGRVDGVFVDSFPFDVTAEVINRGQQRYNIFCAPCHDAAGNGNGIIVRRGFKPPTSFHDQRLVDSPEGYYYNVIKNGFGVMMDYSAQIPVHDRWAIIAYIRALQLTQRATIDDVPENLRADLQGQR
ncbi:MAG TPA: cytochrome c [Kiritimatiellia bacterium]|nr:cytochrome c [Kiritimatiellia bacterium]HMO97800.1 cytochrome c [Kiritimatiellia bacterium]HMP96392.1 cytochrome c [Kiritimatiellia bacterium]